MVMSLSPGEREALSEIEGRLTRSDPRLAAMLARWPDQRARGWPARLPGPARWRRAKEPTRILVVAVGLALVIGLSMVGILRSPAPRSPGRQQLLYGNQEPRGTLRTPAPRPPAPGQPHGSQQAPPSSYPYGTYP